MPKLIEDGKAELYVLGAAMEHYSDRQHILENLSADMFFDDRHATIFSALKLCEEEGLNPNFEAVNKAVILNHPEAKHWVFEAYDGVEPVEIDLEKFLWVTQQEGKSVLASAYIKTVARHYARRSIVDVGIELVACKKDEDEEKLLYSCLNKLDKLATVEAHNYTASGEQLLDNYAGGKSFDAWLTQKKSNRKAGKFNLDGPSTGFYSLDVLLGGLAPTRLVVIGARAAIGKTEFVCQLVAKLAGACVPCSVFTMEMSRQEYFLRLLGIILKKNYAALNHGDFTDAFDAEKGDKLEGLRGGLSVVSIVDASGLTVDAFGAMVRREVRNNKSRVIFLDHLGLLRPMRGGMSRYEAVSYNSNALKTIAMKNGVCLVAAAQLNRESERRPSAIPQLHDLRDSGDIEQDANQVILLARNDEKHYVVADVRKNRHGVLDYVKFDYDLSTQTMEEINEAH